MLSCYNKGCGKDFDPANNPDDACRHHPGKPVFHDAYKGWDCCNKKSVDFTEFLNIKGCQLSKHSNVKPIEPEKPKVIEEIEEPVKIPEPVRPSALPRPSFDSPLTTLKPTVAPALKQSIDNLVVNDTKKATENNSGEIPIGTVCKNASCGQSYDSPASDNTKCIHHPGVAIFHEGLKFWSCCTKRTTDFTAFTNQKGCTYGKHKWFSDADQDGEVRCRYDWHQTATNVVIAIYAKMYHYAKSYIKINPIRLDVHLVFPQQNDAEFNLNLELRGIIDVSKASAQMFGTKVEIVLPKAEPGTWATLNFPKTVATTPNTNENIEKNESAKPTKNDDEHDSDVDLNDIEQVRGVKITDA